MIPAFTGNKQNQKKKKIKAADSPEVLQESTVNSVDIFKTNATQIKDVAWEEGKKSITSAWEQLLGVSKPSGPIEMQPGIPVDIARMQEAQAQAAAQEAPRPIALTDIGQEYVRDILGKNNRESAENQQRIETLIVELRRLTASVQAIEKSVVLQAIGPSQRTMKGKYYESFFEWMLLVVQDARRRVEDSGAWLQTMNSKSKKGAAMGKMKKSMNQLLSGERSVSNQTG